MQKTAHQCCTNEKTMQLTGVKKGTSRGKMSEVVKKSQMLSYQVLWTHLCLSSYDFLLILALLPFETVASLLSCSPVLQILSEPISSAAQQDLVFA